MAKRRKHAKRAAFTRLAEILQNREHLAAELQRVGAQPSAILQPLPYAGPIPPTLEDMIRHVADCGLNPERLDVALLKWAAFYRRESGRTDEDEPLDMTTEPIQQVEGDPHADEPNGLGPADPVPTETAPPGDVLPVPAEGPEVPEQNAVGAPAEDVEMADV
ncbi:hypothetical protein ONZ51_g5597 [Trametes cubensis]|nr:hypothetical protein ONZ51_g5597 [Trametes cubensis]